MVHHNAHREFFTLVCSSTLNTTIENSTQDVSKISFQEPVRVSGLTVSVSSGNLTVTCYRRNSNSTNSLQKQVSDDKDINNLQL